MTEAGLTGPVGRREGPGTQVRGLGLSPQMGAIWMGFAAHSADLGITGERFSISLALAFLI